MSNSTKPTRSTGALAGAGALFLAALIWGVSYLVVKDILQSVSPVNYLFYRFALAIPVAMLLYRRRFFGATNPSQPPTQLAGSTRLSALLPGLFLAAAFLTQAYGMRDTSPGVAAFLTSLLFLVPPALEMTAKRRWDHQLPAAVLVPALAGTALMTQVIQASFQWSDLLLLICAVGYGGHIYFSGKVVQKRHFSVTFVQQSLVVVAVVGLVGLLNGDLGWVTLSTADLIRLIYVVFIATFACYSLQLWGQQFVPARYVGVIFCAEPIAAFALSGTLGYEAATLSKIAGAGLITVAVIISLRQAAKAPSVKTPKRADKQGTRTAATPRPSTAET